MRKAFLTYNHTLERGMHEQSSISPNKWLLGILRLNFAGESYIPTHDFSPYFPQLRTKRAIAPLPLIGLISPYHPLEHSQRRSSAALTDNPLQKPPPTSPISYLFSRESQSDKSCLRRRRLLTVITHRFLRRSGPRTPKYSLEPLSDCIFGTRHKSSFYAPSVFREGV